MKLIAALLVGVLSLSCGGLSSSELAKLQSADTNATNAQGHLEQCPAASLQVQVADCLVRNVLAAHDAGVSADAAACPKVGP